MRILLGIILGFILTIGGAYLYDNHHQAVAAPGTQANTQRPLVNWNVVGRKWDHLTRRARAEWVRVAG